MTDEALMHLYHGRDASRRNRLGLSPACGGLALEETNGLRSGAALAA